MTIAVPQIDQPAIHRSNTGLRVIDHSVNLLYPLRQFGSGNGGKRYEIAFSAFDRESSQFLSRTVCPIFCLACCGWCNLPVKNIQN